MRKAGLYRFHTKIEREAFFLSFKLARRFFLLFEPASNYHTDILLLWRLHAYDLVRVY